MTVVYTKIVRDARNKTFKTYSYTKASFKADFKILMNLYRLCTTERVDNAIDIYFKIKFFKHLEKFPLINARAYTVLEDGEDIAVQDVAHLAQTSYFQ
jgi:hypothetical protein